MTVGCVLVGLFALYQVFFPLTQGNQFSLILFLAAVLPLTLLCYRSGLRLHGHNTGIPRQIPTLLDWLLAVVALVACLYPVLPFQIADGGGGFDQFLSRQGTPATADVIVGTSCCCWCWRPAAAPRAPRCRSCVCWRWATRTTAATCRRVR